MIWSDFVANVKLAQENLEREVKILKPLATEFRKPIESHIWAAIRLIEQAAEELDAAIDV